MACKACCVRLQLGPTETVLSVRCAPQAAASENTNKQRRSPTAHQGAPTVVVRCGSSRKSRQAASVSRAAARLRTANTPAQGGVRGGGGAGEMRPAGLAWDRGGSARSWAAGRSARPGCRGHRLPARAPTRVVRAAPDVSRHVPAARLVVPRRPGRLGARRQAVGGDEPVGGGVLGQVGRGVAQPHGVGVGDHHSVQPRVALQDGQRQLHLGGPHVPVR